MPAARSRALPSRLAGDALLACGIFALGALVWHTMRLQNDGFWSLATGDWLLAHRRLPDRDPFSFASSSDAWVVNMCAYQIAMALAARTIGLGAVLLLNTAAYVGALLLFVLPYARSWVARGVGLALCVVQVLVEHDLLTARGKNFGDLAFAGLFLWSWRLRDGARFRWYVPFAIGVFWVNSHPSFMLLAAVPMAFWALGQLDDAGDRVPLRPFVATAVLGMAATLLNPNTIHAIPDALTLYWGRTTAHIDQFRPPDFARPEWFGALALSVGIIVARAFWGDARHRHSEVALLVVALVGALVARRHATFLFGIQTAILCSQIDRRQWGSATTAPRWCRPAAPVAALALLLAGMALATAKKDPLADAPVASAEFIAEHGLPDRVFNSYTFGGYLDWAWRGERRTFWDGRNNLFENGAFFDAARLEQAAPGYETILDTYEIRTVLVHRDMGLARALAADERWQLAFTDRVGAVFVRRNPAVPSWDD
ncbi:hypothetical protein KF840_09950 [bacterium]|nr:hypothetical protein [bacterium]